MRTWMLLLLLGGACKGAPAETDTDPSDTDTDTDTDADTDSDADTDTDSDTDADADTDTDSDTDTDTDTDTDADTDADTDLPCTSGDTCEIAVAATNMSCGSDAPNFSAYVSSPGVIAVTHTAFQQGCCPTYEIRATATESTRTLEATYTITSDECDCVCWLEATWRLQDIPSGDWTVKAPGGASTLVVVP